MKKTFLIASMCTAMLAVPVEAASAQSMRDNIARELPHFGYRDVDVDALSTAQVAHINSLIHSGRSQGEIRGQIGSTLRGGLLQRTLGRIFR